MPVPAARRASPAAKRARSGVLGEGIVWGANARIRWCGAPGVRRISHTRLPSKAPPASLSPVAKPELMIPQPPPGQGPVDPQGAFAPPSAPGTPGGGPAADGPAGAGYPNPASPAGPTPTFGS